MKRTTLGIIGICVVAALVILIVTLPVSGGKAAGLQDGSGNQYGGQMFQNGTGLGCQQTGSENISCIREDCPNNGIPKRDGTGQKLGQSGKSRSTGSQSGPRGQGCGGQNRG
ncbi:MAG: hypothetical protein V1862_00175 [Methanobacteriota archaeon]